MAVPVKKDPKVLKVIVASRVQLDQLALLAVKVVKDLLVHLVHRDNKVKMVLEVLLVERARQVCVASLVNEAPEENWDSRDQAVHQDHSVKWASLDPVVSKAVKDHAANAVPKVTPDRPDPSVLKVKRAKMALLDPKAKSAKKARRAIVARKVTWDPQDSLEFLDHRAVFNLAATRLPSECERVDVAVKSTTKTMTA